MFGMPEFERRALEDTYEDTCTIKRFVDVTEGNLTQKRAVPVAQGVICAYCPGSPAAGNQTDLQNELVYEAKLLLPPHVQVHAGDYIDVQRFGRTGRVSFNYAMESAGESVLYPTHQEIALKRRDYA